MLALGIDTALKSCSAAILKDGAVVAEKRLALEKGHAEHLAPMIAALLVDGGIAVRDLDRVGVVIGPGGFAGVRVGLAFARGLALGTKVKVVGVTSLAALAAAIDGEVLVASVIDARREQVYAALFENGAVRAAPFVATPEETMQRLTAAAGGARFALVGDGVLLLGALPGNAVIAEAPVEIDPKIVAQLAAASPEPSSPPSPLYLRPPDAKPGAPSLFAGLLRSDA